MNLLLDTHSFLWWVANDRRLSGNVIREVGSELNTVYLSAASGWEIAIKARLGKLPLPEAPDTFVARMVAHHALTVLPISMRHAVYDFTLPNHHSDPFDRLLVAQAVTEELVLVTNDEKIASYRVATLW